MRAWSLLLSLAVACQPKPIISGVATDSGDPGTTSVTGTAPTGPTTPTNPGSTGPLTARITDVTPTVELGQTATVTAEVASTAPGAIAVTWESDVAGPLASGAPDPGGNAVLATPSLDAGWHHITLTATQGPHTAIAETDIGVCQWPALEDFASGASLNGWTLFGNAAWDPGGWLEITGAIQSSDGAIFKTDEKVNPGNVAIEFDIATGGGINTGADGFAVSVIDAYDPTELAQVVNAAANGGCLGYGTDGGCGTLPINAFHIEFDTWHNPELGDATSENHIAIALYGDPTPLLWVAVPTLEDLVWRHVRVEITGSDVTVLLDGAQVIQGSLPGFTFDGGYIGVSGSTGWATNYHRFDNLQLYDLCQVPSATP